MPETLASLGEFGLIARLEALLAREGRAAPGLVLGLGDDAAAVRPAPGFDLLFTCDCLVAGRHYPPGLITPRELGRRAMAVNLSDIGAMGGQPLYALVHPLELLSGGLGAVPCPWLAPRGHHHSVNDCAFAQNAL